MSDTTNEILARYNEGIATMRDTDLPTILRASTGVYLAGISYALAKLGIAHDKIPDIEEKIRPEKVQAYSKWTQ